MRRVNEAVRSVVADAISDLKDPRIGLVTVTGVVVTADLSEATVFVSVLGNERRRRATLVGCRIFGVLQGETASSNCAGLPRWHSHTMTRSSAAFG